jgi:phage shock protein A
MFRRWWAYIKAWFRGASDKAMDPEIEIQMAIDESRKRDQELRNQAAKVVAYRTQLESKIEKAADSVGEAREMAKVAIMKAEDAKAAGDAAGVDKWTKSAQALAMKLQASENNLTSLKSQYEIAVEQAEDAKSAVQNNAMRLQELSAKRMELLGSLEQAKMQEAVNKAVESMSVTMDDELPSLSQVEEKIERRKAEAMAKTELRAATPEGAEAELREAVNLAQADAKLEELKAELGLTTDDEVVPTEAPPLDTGTAEATGLES